MLINSISIFPFNKRYIFFKMSHKFYKSTRSRLQKRELEFPCSSSQIFEKVEILKHYFVIIIKNPFVTCNTVKSVLEKM